MGDSSDHLPKVLARLSFIPMSKLEILIFPDSRLRNRAKPVPTVNNAVRRALDDLLERPGMRSYRVEGDAKMDDAVRRAVEEAGGRVVEAGPARACIEDLFVETYRAGEDDADAGDAGDR